jgi:protein-export membrane protein SecD
MYFPKWQIGAIVFALIVAFFLAVPNVLPKGYQEVLSSYGLRPMTLGLDLQGGANVLLEVDRDDLISSAVQLTASDTRRLLREGRIGYSDVQMGATSVSVRIVRPDDLAKAQDIMKTLVQPVAVNPLTGFSGGNFFDMTTAGDRITLQKSDAGVNARIEAAVKQSLEILKRRIDSLGTLEPVVQQQGKERVVVQVPGLEDTGRLLDIIDQAAVLRFHLLCNDQPANLADVPPPECVSFPAKDDVDRLIKSKNEERYKPTQEELRALPQTWAQTASNATIDGANLVDAQPAFDNFQRPMVSFRLNSTGARQFARLTTDNVQRPFAIVLDGIVQSAPNIEEPITGGIAQITGRFTVQETADLSIVLRSGALPAKLNIVEERTVGPSLGADSVRAGLMAAIIGLIGIMAFMILPYGLFGWFANFALVGNLLLLIACMSFFGFTLTLPGIAGVVLTLGMAVDSNVLIYERIREEWRNGRTALSAIDQGFKAALGTVLDANLTTLIAAVVLFGVGSGPIRGFAVTLALGIFTTMFTAFTLTKLVVSLWVRYKRPKEINL